LGFLPHPFLRLLLAWLPFLPMNLRAKSII